MKEMTDKQLAEEIMKTVKSLNELIHEASGRNELFVILSENYDKTKIIRKMEKHNSWPYVPYINLMVLERAF